MAEFIPRAVIFDDTTMDVYRRLCTEGVQQAGWQPLTFDNPTGALHELASEDGADALITALGSDGNLFQAMNGAYPAEPLLRLAQHEFVPIALVSAHPDAVKYLPSTKDSIVVPKLETDLIVPRISSWLINLA